MVNREMYQFTRKLADDPNFKECTSLTERSIQEQFDLELVARFLVFRCRPNSDLSFNDLGDFLTEKMVELASQSNYAYDLEEHAFRATFRIIKESAGEDCFRRYDPGKSRFIGPFSVSAFEAIALGIGFNPDRLSGSVATVLEKIKNLWINSTFTNNSGSGIRASTRIPRIVVFAREFFIP
jgi:hypothetical protein